MGKASSNGVESVKGSLPVQSMASILSIKSIVRLPENRNVANEPVSGKDGKDGKNGKNGK